MFNKVGPVVHKRSQRKLDGLQRLEDISREIDRRWQQYYRWHDVISYVMGPAFNYQTMEEAFNEWAERAEWDDERRAYSWNIINQLLAIPDIKASFDNPVRALRED